MGLLQHALGHGLGADACEGGTGAVAAPCFLLVFRGRPCPPVFAPRRHAGLYLLFLYRQNVFFGPCRNCLGVLDDVRAGRVSGVRNPQDVLPQEPPRRSF